MNHPWLSPLTALGQASDIPRKAQVLGKLAAQGFAVPPGVLLHATAFDVLLAPTARAHGFASAHELLRHQPALAHAACATVELPADLRSALQHAIRDWNLIAVRSAMTLEDASAHAAAGVFASEVPVPAHAVEAAIRLVWQSACTQTAAAYRARIESDRDAAAVDTARMTTTGITAAADDLTTPAADANTLAIKAHAASVTAAPQIRETNPASSGVAIVLQAYEPGPRVVVYAQSRTDANADANAVANADAVAATRALANSTRTAAAEREPPQGDIVQWAGHVHWIPADTTSVGQNDKAGEAHRAEAARAAHTGPASAHDDSSARTSFTKGPSAPHCSDDAHRAISDIDHTRRREAAAPQHVAAAASLARAIAAALHWPSADVELIARFADDTNATTAANPTFAVVQARPLHHTRSPRLPPAMLLAPYRNAEPAWQFDRSHNPMPLSTAQAELVRAVAAAGVAPFQLAVIGGYLYWRSPHITGAVTSDAATATLAPPSDADSHALACFQLLWAFVRWQIATLLAQARPDDTFAATVARYVRFYDVWTNQAAPLVKQAKRIAQRLCVPLSDQAQRALAQAVKRPHAVDYLLQRAARGDLTVDALRDLIGVVAPSWDVAAPTYAESWPELVAAVTALQHRQAGNAAANNVAPAAAATPATAAAATPAAAATAAATTLSDPAPSYTPLQLAWASVAADSAEEDDLWFFAAQTMIRSALLRVAHSLALDADDVFWLPWSRLFDVNTPLSRQPAHVLANAQRRAAARARAWQMPAAIGQLVPLTAPLATTSLDPHHAPALRGDGPVFSGRVWRVTDDTRLGPPLAGTIIVARAITPGMALSCAHAIGLVAETGSYLDHGAAIARELGIPYLVGATGIFDAVEDGQRITVDPQRGTWTRH